MTFPGVPIGTFSDSPLARFLEVCNGPSGVAWPVNTAPPFRFGREYFLFCFFLLTFVLSWAGMLAAVQLSPGGLAATPEQLQQLLGVAVAGMLLGPLVAGLLMTWLVDGRGGLHELRLRLM